MGQAIEDAAKQAAALGGDAGPKNEQPPQQSSPVILQTSLPAHDEQVNKPEVKTLLNPIEELIKAQHLYIEAQANYIHNKDLPTMAAEMESYIRAQMRCISALMSGSPA